MVHIYTRNSKAGLLFYKKIQKLTQNGLKAFILRDYIKVEYFYVSRDNNKRVKSHL